VDRQKKLTFLKQKKTGDSDDNQMRVIVPLCLLYNVFIGIT